MFHATDNLRWVLFCLLHAWTVVFSYIAQGSFRMDKSSRVISNVIFAQQQKICLFIIITHGEAENQGNRMHQNYSFAFLHQQAIEKEIFAFLSVFYSFFIILVTWYRDTLQTNHSQLSIHDILYLYTVTLKKNLYFPSNWFFLARSDY